MKKTSGMSLGAVIFLTILGVIVLLGQLTSAQEQEDKGNGEQKSPLFGHSEVNTTNGKPLPLSLYADSATCQSCHQDAFKEWQASAHASSARRDPFYDNLEEDFAVKEMGSDFTRWCAGCHTPLALSSGQIGNDRWTERRAELEGVSCALCHTISDVRVGSRGVPHDGSYTTSPDLVRKYPFENSQGLGKIVNNYLIRMAPDAHKQSFSKDFYSSAEYCATCHTEFIPTSGAKSFDTYSEWKNSAYNTDNPAKTRTCIDCHMAAYPSDPEKKNPGRSTKFGPWKENMQNHRFVGANQALPWLYGDQEQFRLVEDMLRSAAEVKIVSPNTEKPGLLTFSVQVTNIGAGHYLPTGVADLRQIWLEVYVQDGQGKKIFHSGNIAEDGEIDPEARMFNVIIADKDGKPLLNHETWRKAGVIKDNRIPPQESKIEKYIVELPENVRGPIELKAVLRFRAFPQRLAQSLIREVVPPGGDKRLPITDMAAEQVLLELAAAGKS